MNANRQKRLRPSFVVTAGALAVAALTPACAMNADGQEPAETTSSSSSAILGPGILNPPRFVCPTAAPAEGSVCFKEGETCEYSKIVGHIDTVTDAVCENGTWNVTSHRIILNPPPPTGLPQ
jgi:hypothetical protein